MLESILDYERNLFLWMNNCHSAFANQFMWLFSSKIAWIPSALSFIIILLYCNKARWKEILLIFAAIVLVITLCDQFSSGFCKPFFSRFRPTHHPEFFDKVYTVFDYRGGRFGFISSHAANAFGFATLTSLIFRYPFYSVTLYTWATINSFSRIYLGVHFISDILPAIFVGLFFGWIVYKLYLVIHKKIIVSTTENAGLSFEDKNPNYKGLNTITYILIGTVICLTIISLIYA